MRLRVAVPLVMLALACASCHASHITGRDNAHELFMNQGTCSGTAVGPHTILTATHCFHEKNEKGVVEYQTLDKVDDRPAQVIEQIEDGKDHTIAVTNLTFKTWAKISDVAPEVGDAIHYWGAPGYFTILLRKGTVIGSEAGVTLLDVNGWYGDSGSGILNDQGDIVGVMSSIHVDPESDIGGALQFMGMIPLDFTPEQLKKIR